MPGTITVAVPAALAAAGTRVEVAGRAAAAGRPVGVPAGLVDITVIVDALLPTGRLSGRIAARVPVAEGGASRVALPSALLGA